MTPQKLRAMFPNASDDFIRENSNPEPNHPYKQIFGVEPAVVEPAVRPDRAPGVRGETPHPVAQPPVLDAHEIEVQGEESNTGRYTLRITSYRCKLLDPDNLVGGCKFFVDACRYNRLIPEDTTQSLRLLVSQKKVRTRAEEKTVIRVEPPQ